MDATPDAVSAAFEIPDPAIDAAAIARRIETALATRLEPPPAPQREWEALAAERLALQVAIRALKEACAAYGTLEAGRPGLRGRLESWVKRGVLFLIRRHVLQQAAVHERLATALDCLSSYLARHERLSYPQASQDAPCASTSSSPT